MATLTGMEMVEVRLTLKKTRTTRAPGGIRTVAMTIIRDLPQRNAKSIWLRIGASSVMNKGT